MRVMIGAVFAGLLGITYASANLMNRVSEGGTGELIECEVTDAQCITDYATGILSNTFTDTSVNNYGQSLGRMWPYLSVETRDQLFADYPATLDDSTLAYDVGIGRARIAPYPISIDDLSSLFNHTAEIGDLPAIYYAETLALALLETDPGAVADLAVADGDGFQAFTPHGLYRAIAWMTRNDLDRLNAYLEGHKPYLNSSFNVYEHMFFVAAERCAAGDEKQGNQLREIAENDLGRRSVLPSLKRAWPIPAILACDGLDAALDAKDNLLTQVPLDKKNLLEADISRSPELEDSLIGRTVRRSVLAPLVRALHAEDRDDEAEALATKILPWAPAFIFFAPGDAVPVKAEEIEQTIAEILRQDAFASSSLDPVIVLDWFNNSADREACCYEPGFSTIIGPSIILDWPSDAATEAASRALPLLEAGTYMNNLNGQAVSLRLNIARRNLPDCTLSDEQLHVILDQISALERGLDQVNRISDYLTYLDRHAQSEAVKHCPNL